MHDELQWLCYCSITSSSLVMDGSMIAENKILQVLGFTLVSKGTWLAHVDSIVKEAQQKLGANS